MKLRFCITSCVCSGLLLTLSVAAYAQSKVETLGRFGDWAGYTYVEDGQRVCYAASVPVKSTGKVSKRGNVMFLVTHRPKFDDIGVVTAVSGYSFGKGETASVKIGGNRFSFFTRDGNAWAKGGDDEKVVKAMKKSNTLRITSSTKRGVKTSDQYSLIGFSQAYKKISTACKVGSR